MISPGKIYCKLTNGVQSLTRMNNEKVIPSHIQIEIVAGMCTVRCIMCPIKQSKRNEIMDNETLTKIARKLQPYLAQQEFLSFCGLGESLLDKNIHEKIRIVRRLGFKGIGVYTNGTILNEKTSENILDAKLDTLIVSIDGFSNGTQAAIRVGSKLEEIVSNVENFIAIRNEKESKARIVIRFTKQDLNKHEEKDFSNFWDSRIDRNRGDKISIYNVHNFGGNISNFDEKLNEHVLDAVKKFRCPEIYERLVIFSDGTLGICCGDQFGHYTIGNVLDDDPVDLFNSEHFIYYRSFMQNGKIMDLDLCKNCSIVYSIATREIS